MKSLKYFSRCQLLFQRRIALSAVLCFLAMLVRAQPAGSRLTIDLSKPGHAISPLLYNGMLFEEIGHGIDGGFYAQLIRNNSFEDNNPVEGWSLVKPGSSSADMFVQMTGETEQLNRNQSHCLKFNIRSVSSGSVGLANSGYWGIRLDNNTKYKVSFFAKVNEGPRHGDKFQGALTVKLESNSGTVFAASDPIMLTTKWQQYSCELTTSGISNVTGDNRFVIYGSSPGVVYLDMVSMMPPAYNNRPNGLRKDMAEMQAALHPKFIRFPGGCDVEYTGVDSGWNWKKAIGPIEQRPGEVVQRWHYHNSQQLGLDEMFQMCEDWGAEPIYCTSMSIDDGYVVVPIEQLQPFVQDVLDLIEYANGDSKTSLWGKQRAANGHPAPYNLKYIEVGNENGTTEGYPERYAIFYDAIKKVYPAMKVIINDKLSGQKADIIDEHFYGSYDDFLKWATCFDGYDRNGPKIVAGEYSCGQETGSMVGNLKCAIGEACFLTGCERNSDIVISTTYGTLSGNVNAGNWFPNLYYNNSVSAFAIPSYYLEKMFVENTGDVILPYKLSGGLYVAPSRVNSNGDLIIKVVNASDIISNMAITLNGVGRDMNVNGIATTLTSNSTSDENSLAQPTNVVPTTSRFIARRRFNYSFLPNSITVLRIGFSGNPF